MTGPIAPRYPGPMALFKKKASSPAPKESLKKPFHGSLEEIVHERVLTAEGWRRKILSQSGRKAK
ncbi:MAG: hypothetical protein V4487_07715 [Chlamydiota bacterium]